MPYVQRDDSGEIIGVFRNPQEGFAEEFLEESELKLLQADREQTVASNPLPQQYYMLYRRLLALPAISRKVYEFTTVRQSIKTAAAFHLLTSTLTGGFMIAPLQRALQDLRDEMSTVREYALTETELAQIRQALTECGFDLSSVSV